MFKHKYRVLCKQALEQAGWKNAALVMDRVGEEYNSYWVCGDRHAIALCDRKTLTVYAFEVAPVDAGNPPV